MRKRRTRQRPFGSSDSSLCLKLLHPPSSLSTAKLSALRRLSTERLLASLEPGKRDALKVHPDGTVMDGHHRLAVLCERAVDVNQLPREVVSR